MIDKLTKDKEKILEDLQLDESNSLLFINRAILSTNLETVHLFTSSALMTLYCTRSVRLTNGC
jgi:hypothetical protein